MPGSNEIQTYTSYIPPEQIHGIPELDGRTDQYCFAVMTYQMLTGKKPLERNNT